MSIYVNDIVFVRSEEDFLLSAKWTKARLHCESESEHESHVCNRLSSSYNYRPQTKFAKVMFLQVCVCPQGGMRGRGACMAGWGCVVGGPCVAGEHVWQGGGHAWQGGHVWQGDMHGRGHAWHARPWQILRLWHTVNERAVSILLECILVPIVSVH